MLYVVSRDDVLTVQREAVQSQANRSGAGIVMGAEGSARPSLPKCVENERVAGAAY